MSAEPPAPPPPLWPFVLGCAAAALWIDLGSLHRAHHSDSVLSTLASLYAWKPFFWGADRVGLLVPLLARPIHHPFYNLLFQTALNTWAGLLAPFLLARYLFRSAFYPRVALACVLSFLFLATTRYRFEFYADLALGTPFCLGYAALLLGMPTASGRIPWWRWPLALLLSVLAHWVYLATFLTLTPLVVLRGLLVAPTEVPGPGGWWRAWLPGRETFFTLVVCAVGLAAGLGLRHLAEAVEDSADLGTLPLVQWPVGWGSLFCFSWQYQVERWCTWPALLTLAVLVPLLVSRLRREALRVARPAACALGAGLAAYLFLGTRKWIGDNGFHDRYLMPSLLDFQVAAFALLLAPWRVRALGWRGYAVAGLAGAVALGFDYGLPSLAGARADLDRVNHTQGFAVVDRHCTHVAGCNEDYWMVWITVYHANLLKYERGEPGVVWGVCYRGRAAWSRWRDPTDVRWRVAAPPEHETMARQKMQEYGLEPAQVSERIPGLVILEHEPAEDAGDGKRVAPSPGGM